VTPGPQLSVAVVVGERRTFAAELLASLFAQGAAERLEILLLDVAPNAAPVAGSDHPSVRRFALPPDTLFATARTRAVAEARAPILAFLEEHTLALPGWAEGLLDAYREAPWAGVGAEAHNANPGVGASDAIGLMSYGRWYPPQRPGETDFLPGHNASYRVDVLRSYGAELETLLGCDIALQQCLRRDGHHLAMAPAARFAHRHEHRFATLAAGLFLWYRGYGPLRARLFGWGWPRRLIYVAAVPLIPLYFLLGHGRHLVREGKQERSRLWRGIPGIYFVQLCGALGQATGLLFGPGDAARRFTRYELTAERPSR